jgi:hypothetical protein
MGLISIEWKIVNISNITYQYWTECNMQLPPQFNMPKSQLQVYGDSVVCSARDLLSKCVEGINPLERFKAVVAWSISTTRPVIFSKVPYNPILGETHHVSCGNLNVLLEQVQFKLVNCDLMKL